MSMKDFNADMAHRYEPQNFQSVRETLKPGDIVYDVGAYDGITSAILAEIVGPENVVIIEPGEMNWATIKAYWDAHGFAPPRATFAGFADEHDKPYLSPLSVVHRGEFPPEALQFPVSDHEEGLNFRFLNDRNTSEAAARPSLRLDTISPIAGMPAGIVMDVEGAEFHALAGAINILEFSHCPVWVSIHPEFMKQRFGHDELWLHQFMFDRGYTGAMLSTYQEQHWLFKANP